MQIRNQEDEDVLWHSHKTIHPTEFAVNKQNYENYLRMLFGEYLLPYSTLEENFTNKPENIPSYTDYMLRVDRARQAAEEKGQPFDGLPRRRIILTVDTDKDREEARRPLHYTAPPAGQSTVASNRTEKELDSQKFYPFQGLKPGSKNAYTLELDFSKLTL